MNTKEVCQTFNISRQRLLVMRRGQKVKKKNKAGEQEYTYDALLTRGEDWDWVDRCVVYTKAGVNKIRKYLKGK